MIRLSLLAVLLVLGGCSGTSRVCAPPPPAGSGFCQETIRDVGLLSHTTATIITDGAGRAVDPSKAVGAVQSGWLNQINPIAAMVPSVMTSAGSLSLDLKGSDK